MVGQSESDDMFVSGVKAKELMITGSSILLFLFQWENRNVDIFTMGSLISGIKNKIPSDLLCPIWATILIFPHPTLPRCEKVIFAFERNYITSAVRKCCWTWQLLIAFEIKAIKLRPKGLRPFEIMTVLVKLRENGRSSSENQFTHSVSVSNVAKNQIEQQSGLKIPKSHFLKDK